MISANVTNHIKIAIAGRTIQKRPEGWRVCQNATMFC